MMSSGSSTVVVGFAESFAAIEAAWSLTEAGFAVVAFTRRGTRPPLRHDRRIDIVEVTAPEDDVTACAAEIDQLLAARKAAALLPLDDASLWLTTRLRLDDCQLVGPDPTGAMIALDKSRQVALAQEAGLEVPPTRVLPLSQVRYEGEPFVIKPSDAVREVDNKLTRPAGRFCGSESELAAAQRELPEGVMLVQPVIKGTGVGLFGARLSSGFAPWSGHRRVRMVNPSGSASSACDSIDVDPDLRTRTEKLLLGIDWSGLFMAEFLVDDAGRAWFMELNGRAWGSLALARRRGFEYPAWAVQDALGRPPTPPAAEHPPEIRARHLGREITHLAFVLRGPQSQGVGSWPSRRSTIRHLLTIHRKDRLYNWSVRQPQVLFADTAKTVADQLLRLRLKR